MRFRTKILFLVTLITIGLTGGYHTVRYSDYLQQKDVLKISINELSNKIYKQAYSLSTEAVKNLSKNEIIIKTATNELQIDNLDSVTLLNHAKLILDSSLVYILNSEGQTVACTPYGENLDKTLTGNNYSFRKYFQEAIKNQDTHIMPEFGVTTVKRGIYISHPIIKDNIPVGTLVIKQKAFPIDEIFTNVQYTSAWCNPQGIIFATNNENWLSQNLSGVYSKSDHHPNASNQQDQSQQQTNTLMTLKEATIDNARYLIAADYTGVSGWKTLMLKPYVGVKPAKLLIGCSLGIMLSLLVFFTTTYFIDKSHSTKLMTEQQQRLNLALEGGELGTWDWNIPSGSIIFNDRWSTMLGYKLSEIEPHFTTWELYIHPEDKAGVEKDLEDHLTNKTETYQSSFRMRHKDGSWKWILSKGKIVERSLEGEPIRICGTHLDISLQKKLESELTQHQKLESVGRLAAGIAHEINTPAQFIGSNLNFITESFTDILQMVDKLSLLLNESPEIDKKQLESIYEEADWDYLQEEVPSALKQSEDGINQVSSIVLAMKRFSHPGTKEKAVTDLNEVIETALIVSRSEWKFVAETNLELDPELAKIPLIVDEISQVILNMIVNAAHAIVEKNKINNTEEKGTIQISTEQIDNFAVLKIRDDGCGMPQEVINNIFEPFFTTKEVGKGTGQGLTLCHDVIINKHGGFIEVESGENVGTSFTIKLPVI